MKIIPVIDLKNGYVVHAKRGQRENYQPIQSHLCKQADIFSVIEHFLSLYAFDTFYIADLDAITFSGNNQKLIEKTLAHFPKKQFWIDTGYQKIHDFPENYLPVLGSECFNNDNIDELLGFKKRFVTSLDFDISDNPKLFCRKL